jgi:magnesium chelatase family protein
VAKYRGKISGPLLDRIDLQIEVPAVPEAELTGAATGETSAVVRERVAAAAALQQARQGKANSQLGPKEIELHCVPEAGAEKLLRQAITRLNLSARAYHRILKVARSIADLAGSATIASAHIAEAVQYRRGLEGI